MSDQDSKRVESQRVQREEHRVRRKREPASNLTARLGCINEVIKEISARGVPQIVGERRLPGRSKYSSGSN